MNEFDKKDKKYGKLLKISILIMFILLIIAAIIYTKYQNDLLFVVGVLILFVESIFASAIEFLRITNMTKLLLTEYRKDKSLLSGALGIITITITLFFGIIGTSKIAPSEYESAINTLATTLLGFTPAFLSLIGIHYSNTMQNAYRREDLRNINKPYPIIACKNKAFSNGENPITHIKIDLQISNAANNICVPLYIKHNSKQYNLSYSVISNNCPHHNYSNIIFDTGHEISETTLNFIFGCKDALENIYENEFKLDLLQFENYTLELSEAKLVSKEDHEE